MNIFSSSRGFTSVSEQRRENLFSWRASAAEAKAPRAFTLIETFVATSVLLVTLAAPLSIAAQSLRSAYYARDQVTAFYLAQEAVEYVQAKRDQNYLAGTPWLSGLDECIDTSCNVDFPAFDHEACPTTCPALLISDQTGLFNIETGTPSVFTRAVKITAVPGTSEEVSVTVTVSWVSAGISRQFQIAENLFDWL